MSTRYANGRRVTETQAEESYKTGPIELREAFRAGETSQARHTQEEVPPHLRAMVNLVRTLACRPEARNRHPEDILAQALREFEDRSLESWSA